MNIAESLNVKKSKLNYFYLKNVLHKFLELPSIRVFLLHEDALLR